VLGRRARLLSILPIGLGAGILLRAATAGAAPPQVKIYLGGYGQPSPQPSQSAPAASSAPSASAANAASFQNQAAFVQGVAYERYLQYVAAVQASRMAPGDATQYFTNGASVMTVPSAGPGSAYFTNGAEAARGGTAPTAPAAAAAPPPVPPAPPSLPPAAPLAPFWWVDSPTAAAPPSPPPAAAPASPPAPAAPPPAEERPAEAAMSFEDWLQSMGADVREDESEPSPAPPPPADTEPSLLAEPSAAAYDVRPRASHPLREKLRERAPQQEGGPQPLVLMLGTFAAGLGLGALAMKRGSFRTRTEP
jgi:hypothetical protein